MSMFCIIFLDALALRTRYRIVWMLYLRLGCCAHVLSVSLSKTGKRSPPHVISRAVDSSVFGSLLLLAQHAPQREAKPTFQAYTAS